MPAIFQTPRPFRLQVPEQEISALRQRLALTRWPDEAPGPAWAYGTSLSAARELIAHWQHRFDWRQAEAALNALPQYKVGLPDIDLHFLHVPGKGPKPMPLLLAHGWPGSVFEFLELIPRLSDPARFGGDPADAFTVVAPSLPGFGLSFSPGQARFGTEAMANLLRLLMTQVLGYERFGAQGGDWGAFVTSRLAFEHPELLTGLHLNLLVLPRDGRMPAQPDAVQRRYFEELAHFLREETGYQAIQGTRPQTLAFAMSDSPAGLAAWILEKFRAWSDCDGDPIAYLGADRLLANISLYWFTGAIGSSFWPYYHRAHNPWPIPPGQRIQVPTGYSAFPKEILRPPRSLAQEIYPIVQWREHPKGGHFAAMEQPQALAEDIRDFFRPMRAGG